MKLIEIGGKHRPIHFGFWALKTISEELKIDQSDILGGMLVTDLGKQITIIRIGLDQGNKEAARSYHQPLDPQIHNLGDEDLAAWLDQRPEALEEGIALYIEQAFGKKIQALIAELEKNPTTTAVADNLKNALSKIRSQLPSTDLPKSAPAG